jgi:hypothetical protein
MLILSWCWKKSGDDGRRPSGHVYRRGKAHAIWADNVAQSVCGREVNLYPTTESAVTCRQCLKKLGGQHGSGRI